LAEADGSGRSSTLTCRSSLAPGSLSQAAMSRSGCPAGGESASCKNGITPRITAGGSGQMSLSGAGWPAALPALTTFARPGVLDNVSAGFAKRQRDVGAGIRRDSQSLQTSVGAGHLPLCTGPVHGRVECNEPHDARASSLTALPRDACLSALPSCAPGQCSCGLSCPRSNCGPGAQHLNRRAAAPQLVAFPELTERRNPQLATAQHQDDQDDKHDENDGSYADVHELSLSYQSLRPRRRPRAGYPAQSGLTREPTRARWRPRFSGRPLP